MKQKETYSNIDLLKFLIRNFRPILAVTITGTIISIVVSLLITPKFKSAVIIYPANTSSVSKALLTDMTMTPKDIMKFGEERETEQLMQILLSDEIKARIIQKHDLAKHYNINTNSKFYKTLLQLQYNDNISFKKTEFQAIEIKVMDTDPKFAANIANDIASLLDSVYNKIQKDRALKALAVVEKVYKEQEVEVKKLDSLSEFGSSHGSLKTQLEDETKQLVFLKSKLTEARVDAFNDLPHKYVVNQAQVSEKKDYPKRFLIVIFSCISTFIFSIFLLLIIERFRNIKSELVK